MPNSMTIVCRAVVMLGCLVAIPMVALFGLSLPQFVTAVLDGRTTTATSEEVDLLDEAPRFVAAEAETGEAVVAGSYESTPGGALVQHAAPTAARPTVGAATGSAEAMAAAASSGAIPAGFQAPMTGSGRPPAAWQDQPMAQPNAGLNPPSGGAFVDIQDRLRSLGAAYYRLESWGNQQRLFRFQCEMTLGGSPNLTQHFEATANDPLEAMGKVLAEVETWKAQP